MQIIYQVVATSEIATLEHLLNMIKWQVLILLTSGYSQQSQMVDVLNSWALLHYSPMQTTSMNLKLDL